MSAGASAYSRALWLTCTLRVGQAKRWRIGAAAEAATARLAAPLRREGWHFVYDRAVGKANLDGLGITPCGSALAFLETKRWRAGSNVTFSDNGALMCGGRLQQRDIDSLLYEVSHVRMAASVPVVPVMVIHGPTVGTSGHLRTSFFCRRIGDVVDVDVIEARHLPTALRSMVRGAADGRRAADLAAWTKDTFPARAPWLARVMTSLATRSR